MRTRLLVTLALLTPMIVGAGALTPSATARACGPYGPIEHRVEGQVISSRPASAGLTVEARCGEQVVAAQVDADGKFVASGLRGRECVIEATAHECYTSDRAVARVVSLPSETLTLVMPD